MLPASHKLAAGEKKTRPELADVFRQYGERYQGTHRLSASQQKVMRVVSICRTQELGGHLDRCDRCGFERPAYNSCRNRHCPKCQSLAKARWLQKQTCELLPVGYFHLVFTLPHELNRLILTHKEILLSLLFKAVSETLLEFGHRRFKGTVGIIAVLHTWDQTLKDHFHLHCLVPSGALSLDHSRWIAARQSFLFLVKALSRVFRGKFVDLLKHCERGKIEPTDKEIKALWQKNWNVYAKKPFGSPHTVLDYLGRYTHRVALSNDRILKVENGQVTLSYRDRKDGDRKKILVLDAHEFIRRFLIHVLPDGFMRIRHFGFLANRSKRHLLPQCRKLLDLDPALPHCPAQSAKDLLLKITGFDLTRCPCCRVGTMIVVGDLPALSSEPRWDSFMNKAQSQLISFDCRSTTLARVCLALAKLTLKPVGCVIIREKLSAPISTVIHLPFYL